MFHKAEGTLEIAAVVLLVVVLLLVLLVVLLLLLVVVAARDGNPLALEEERDKSIIDMDTCFATL